MLLNFNKSDYESLHKAFYLNNNNDNDNEYINEDETENEDELEEEEEELNFDEFCLPFSETICDYVQEILEEKFLIDDLSFLFDISRKYKLSPCAILLGMIYLKRLKNCSSSKCKNIFSSTELCLVSLLIASKYLTDEGEENEIYNDDWAKSTKFSIERVNRLERQMLNDLNWDLYVSTEEFWNFTDNIHLRVLRKKIRLQNDICTYNDLKYLLNNLVFLKNTNIQLSYFLKILSTFLATLSYTLYTSFIAYLVLIQIKSVFRSSNNNNNRNLMTPQAIIHDNQTTITLEHRIQLLDLDVDEIFEPLNQTEFSSLSNNETHDIRNKTKNNIINNYSICRTTTSTHHNHDKFQLPQNMIILYKEEGK